MAEPEVEERDDDAYGLDRETVAAVLDAVAGGDAGRVTELLDPLHPADIADLLEQISPDERRALIALWSGQIDGDILSELDESLREEVIDELPREVLAEAVRELDTDDVVDLIEDLQAPTQEIILDALEDSDRAAVEQSLTYPEYSAGRLMQREVVTAPEHWTVGEAIDFLRAAEWLPDQFYHVVLVDPRHRPTAYVTLGKLLSAKRDVRLADLTEDSFRTIGVMEEEGDVAYAFNQYHLISAPVVDADGRLVGVITIDDAMNVLDEEHEEDILRLAGVGEGSLADTVLVTARQRFTWLMVNLMTALVASSVVGLFAETIETIVALAVLMPVVASMGGNAGTQSMAVAVRSLATRDLTPRNALRVIRREIAVGALNGFGFGLIFATVAGFWFGVPMLAAVVAVAMLLTLVVAALAGVVVPVLLDRLGVDPALASGPFVTTLTDVVGFFAFLGLATVLLLLTEAADKAALRHAALARRAEAAAAGDPRTGAARLAEVLAAQSGKVLAGYVAMRGEIDPAPALAEFRGPVCLPVVVGRGLPLAFRAWHPGVPMVEAAFGAPVPATGATLVPEVLVVPLLAFDRQGHRLGYGGGFYDRTLAALRARGPVLAIGFAWAAQEVAGLPVGPHDQRFDLIVTEAGVIRPG